MGQNVVLMVGWVFFVSSVFFNDLLYDLGLVVFYVFGWTSISEAQRCVERVERVMPSVICGQSE
jgi:hypothetical protein